MKITGPYKMDQIWTKEQHEAEKAECSNLGTFELD